MPYAAEFIRGKAIFRAVAQIISILSKTLFFLKKKLILPCLNSSVYARFIMVDKWKSTSGGCHRKKNGTYMESSWKLKCFAYRGALRSLPVFRSNQKWLKFIEICIYRKLYNICQIPYVEHKFRPKRMNQFYVGGSQSMTTKRIRQQINDSLVGLNLHKIASCKLGSKYGTCNMYSISDRPFNEKM